MSPKPALLTGFDLCRAAMSVEGITAPEQSVLTVLAIMSNDEAKCWPGINGPAGLTGKTKLSERTVQRAVQGLKDAGHIGWEEKSGKGRTYTVHPRQGVTPNPRQADTRHSDTPVTETPTPVTVTPNLPVTTITSPVASQPTRTRAPAVAADRYHRLPADWTPSKALSPKLQAKVSEWPPGKVGDELEALHRWAANASNDKGKGRKLNWQIAWENWLDRADNDWRSKNGSVRINRGSAPRTNDGFLNAIRESGERRRAANG